MTLWETLDNLATRITAMEREVAKRQRAVSAAGIYGREIFDDPEPKQCDCERYCRDLPGLYELRIKEEPT